MTSVAGTLPEDYLPGLKGIIETALKQSPTMMLQNINLVQQQAAHYQADSALWPNLGSSFSYAFNGSRTESSTSTTTSGSGGYYGFTLGQSLFQWGAVMNRINVVKLGEQIAQRQYADAFRGLAVSLRAQYLGLVMAKLSLRQARYQLTLQEADLVIQKDMLAEGNISPGDLIGPQMQTDEARLAVKRAEMEYGYGKNMFRRLAGLADLGDDAIPDTLPLVTNAAPTADALLGEFKQSKGPENSLQGQIDALSVKQADLNYKIVRTSLYYPKFSFGAGYGLSYNPTGATIEESTVLSYNYGISANLPLFDGFSTRWAKVGALASKRSAEQQRQNHVEAGLDNAENARLRLATAAEVLRLAEQRRDLAEDALHRSQEEFKEGTVAQKALDSLVLTFNYADYAAVSARVAYLNLWTDFVGMVGADPALRLIPSSYLTLNHGK